MWCAISIEWQDIEYYVLFATSAIHQLGGFLCGGSWPTDEFETLNMIMVVGIEEI